MSEDEPPEESEDETPESIPLEEMNREEQNEALAKEVVKSVIEEGLPEETAPTTPLPLKLESLDDLRKIIVLSRGGDPEAQQTLNNFLKFGDNIERTNLPTRRDVQMVSVLDYAGKTLYPDHPDNPFALAANCISVAFMAKGGDKSKQFVELMKQTPSLADLQTVGVDPQRSIADKILGRGKVE